MQWLRGSGACGGPVRRRWAAALAAALAAVTLAGCDWDQAASGPGLGAPSGSPGPVRTAVAPAASDAGRGTPLPVGERTTDPAPGYPEAGSGAWDVVPGESQVLGTGGPLLRFQVAVERDITALDRSGFADALVATLGDGRSWTATGRWRLQRVPAGQAASFTIYLATPTTRDVLCQSASPDRYTSCRRDNRVVLNVARWVHGVPWYGTDLASYRQYMVNHEVGHRLGQGHERCPGAGRPAPVMQQQTLGLHGCLVNPWVMVDGTRYAGPSGQYDDPIPR